MFGAWRLEGDGSLRPLEVRRLSAREILIENDAPGGRIVVSEIFDRGWKASIEARPLPVEPWDGALLSDMPPERGRIRLVYDPGAFRGGLTGAGLGILLSLVMGIRDRKISQRI